MKRISKAGAALLMLKHGKVLRKGMASIAALEKMNADQDAAKEAERKDRILHPEKYLGK